MSVGVQVLAEEDQAWPQGYFNDSILKTYISGHAFSKPLLTHKEELELARRIQRGDKAAERELVERNLRMVVSIARKMVGRGGYLMDLIQEGNLGLIRAATMFDPDRKLRFSTYAYKWITHYIQRWIERYEQGLIRLPEPAHPKIRVVDMCRTRFFVANGRWPTLEELSEETGLTEDGLRELGELDQMGKPASLDKVSGEMEDQSLHSVLIEPESIGPEEVAETKDMSAQLLRAMKVLTEEEYRVIVLRYGLLGVGWLSLGNVAEIMGMSKQRITSIDREARHRLCAWDPSLRQYL